MRSRGIALAFAAACVSGFSVFINGFAVREFGDPTLYTTMKNLVAVGVLLGAGAILTAARGRGTLALPRTRRDVGGVLLVGVLGGGVAFALFFQGLAVTTPTSAAFVQKTLVVWVALPAAVLLRERLGLYHAGAIALLVIGQFALSGGGAFTPGVGEALVLAATLLWAGEIVVVKSLLRSLSPLTLAVARLGIGVPVLVGIVAAGGGFARLGEVTPQAWLYVVVTGVVLSAYVAIWYSALARAGATDVTAVLVFGAVVTASLSSLAGGSSSAPNLIALLLITLGCMAIARMPAATGPRAHVPLRAG